MNNEKRGFFSFLHSSSADRPGAGASPEELMAYGKRQLFAGKIKPAAKAFSRAVAASPEDPLPLAYRSWAERLEDKARAISDADMAVDLDPSCAEAYMSLALAHATGTPDFEQATMALNVGRKRSPEDADGSVLSIGVYLIFADALASMREDAEGFSYEFRATPLRNAADWLLSGEHAAALAAFEKMHEAGREVAGALGLAATYWVMGDRESARTFAEFVIASGAVKDLGVLSAVRHIQNAWT